MPYNFTMEDFAKFTEDVVKANGDQAALSTYLADMQATVSDAMGVKTKLENDNEVIKGENDRLKNANMDLMYRLGQKAIEETVDKEDKKEKLERGQNVDAYLDKLFEED